MKRYFNTYSLKFSLIVSFFLVVPLYFIHFGVNSLILNTISIFIGLIIFYKIEIYTYPLIGFFTSIFWLWWISLSFIYYDLTFLIPFVIIGIGGFYFLLFLFLTFLRFKCLIILFFLFGLKYITPFGFNWFRYDILLNETYFGKLFFKKKIEKIEIPLKIKIVNTEIAQSKKWKKEFIPYEIENNFNYIKKGIKEGKDIVILPETAFPLPLNRYQNLLINLKKLSYKIVIVVGGLDYKEGNYYNSTYLFKNGEMKIFHKHILVPFGEYIPFECCKNFFNKLFFNGANDFIASPNFGKFKIEGIEFTNAICYEVTKEELYQNSSKYIIAMSNNAWFNNSVERTLQKLLIKFYSEKYGKIVFHAENR